MKESPVLLVHPQVLERFTRLLQNGRLGHAYLFTGPRGIGKLETARAVAKLVNCEGAGAPDCMCASCVKIDRGNHPDVFLVERLEDKTEIIIEQFRDDVLPRLTLKPREGRWKVCIIKDADRISLAAANAFLKTLEEPPRATMLILLSTSPDRILRTIVSRCHEVRFFPLGRRVLAARLESQYDMTPLEADILAKFSAGSPGLAAATRTRFMEGKNTILNEFVFAPASEAILKKYASSRDLARELCEVLLAFFRDVWLWKSGVPEDVLLNRDRLVDVKRLAGKYDLADIRRVVEQIVSSRRAADENFNMKIALTVLKEML